MPSSPHGAKALTDLQTKYTAVKAAQTAAVAAGVRSAAAAEAATAFDLQIAVQTQAQPPLS